MAWYPFRACRGGSFSARAGGDCEQDPCTDHGHRAEAKGGPHPAGCGSVDGVEHDRADIDRLESRIEAHQGGEKFRRERPQFTGELHDSVSVFVPTGNAGDDDAAAERDARLCGAEKRDQTTGGGVVLIGS